MHIVGDSKILELKSEPESLSVVEHLIDDVRTKYSISEDMFGNMLVAITEAVTNAIYHGNKQDPAKRFKISYSTTTSSIFFKIEDEGEGFDFYNLPDPTAPENLDKESGRGIYLMKHLCDQLIFSDSGRVVEMSFKM